MPNSPQRETLSIREPILSHWNAWINTQPPPPDDLHVSGDVEVPNPGVRALLVKRVPQGINPVILQLDLLLVQEPGIWPDVISQAQARYDQTPATGRYESVEIFYQGQSLIILSVNVIS